MIYLKRPDDSNLKYYSYLEILNHLEKAMNQKLPFSLVRFGDGGIKLIHSVLYNDELQLTQILNKEGIPQDKAKWLLLKWAVTARDADYIDTPEIYFTSYFWPRLRAIGKGMTKKTVDRLKMWKMLYNRVKFNNNQYCNPETNYIICTKIRNKWTLIDLIENRKICIIGTNPDVVEKIPNCNIDFIKVVKHYEDQYNNSFHSITSEIEQHVNDYDLWIVAAGELGRLYSGLIKKLGGRSLDFGYALDYWDTGEIPVRLQPFLKQNEKNPLEFKLTKYGKSYEPWL